MARQIRISFVDDQISVDAELYDDTAPKTCQAIWESAPIVGQARHAMLSGQEVLVFLEPVPALRNLKENATTYVIPGDIAFKFVEGGHLHGFPNDVFEIAWYYGRYAEPRLPDGPHAVNIFAKIIGNPVEFYEVSHRVHLEGPKDVIIEAIVSTH